MCYVLLTHLNTSTYFWKRVFFNYGAIIGEYISGKHFVNESELTSLKKDNDDWMKIDDKDMHNIMNSVEANYNNRKTAIFENAESNSYSDASEDTNEEETSCSSDEVKMHYIWYHSAHRVVVINKKIVFLYLQVQWWWLAEHRANIHGIQKVHGE